MPHDHTCSHAGANPNGSAGRITQDQQAAIVAMLQQLQDFLGIPGVSLPALGFRVAPCLCKELGCRGVKVILHHEAHVTTDKGVCVVRTGPELVIPQVPA
jgi:hypothetical protein